MQLKDSDTKNKFLAVFYEDQEKAENAYRLLLSKGHLAKNITVMMASTTRDKYFKKVNVEGDLGNKPKEYMGTKSIIGGAIGTIAATIATISAVFTLSGVGGIVIVGPLITGIAGIGAGFGSTIGELDGIDESNTPGRLNEALISYGLSNDQAEQCRAEMKKGHIMLGVSIPALYYDKLSHELKSI